MINAIETPVVPKAMRGLSKIKGGLSARLFTPSAFRASERLHVADGGLTANFIFGENMIDLVPGMVESQGSLQVKSHTEKDIWEQAREAERLHGDQAEAQLAKRIHDLTAKKLFEEASFWSAVVARLQDLHDIKLSGPTVLPMLLNTPGGKTS